MEIALSAHFTIGNTGRTEIEKVGKTYHALRRNKSCVANVIQDEAASHVAAITVTEAYIMGKTVSMQSLVVEKYTQLLHAAAKRRDAFLGKATPIPVVIRPSQPIRVPVSRRHRVYP